MVVALILGIIFYFLNKFFAVFNQLSKVLCFRIEFDDFCSELYVKVNMSKIQLGCIINFLGLKFNIFKTKTRLPLDKLKRSISKMENIQKKNGLSSHKKLQPLVGLLFFAARVVFLCQAFFQQFYDEMFCKNLLICNKICF